MRKINIPSHRVFYFYNIQQTTFHLFCDHTPHCAWFHSHSAPHCRSRCGGNSWKYWHQFWMHFTNDNCLCKISIYIMDHVVCRYPCSIDLEVNKVKTILTPGALPCGWPPALTNWQRKWSMGEKNLFNCNQKCLFYDGSCASRYVSLHFHIANS